MSAFVKVRAEEVAIGALVGIGTGVVAASPLVLGLPAINPLAAGIGFGGALQAWLLWAAATAGGGLGGWWAARQERDSHVRGVRYYEDYAQASRALQAAQRAQFSAAQRAGKVHGLSLGGVELARTQEVRHLVVNGLTGGGKTALFRSIIDQVSARGDRVLLHDPKGDYTRDYFDPAHGVLLGPWDDRAAIWDAAADIDSPALADQFAQACVGPDVQGENKSFYDNAAKVIAGLVKSYMVGGHAWTWPELATALTGDPAALAAQAVKGDPQVRIAVPSAFRADGKLSNGDSSTFSIVASGTRWMSNYAAVQTADSVHFSVTRWLLGTAHRDVRLVVLNNNPQYRTAAAAIFGAVMESAVAVVNSAQMAERSADEGDALWVVIDELRRAGKSVLEAVQQLSELGRSRGIRCVLAMQDESQLAAEVGEAAAKPMLAVQGARVYLHCSDGTADSVSKRIGEREVNRIETVAENGALSGKTKHLVTSRVIEPSALLGLRVHRDVGVEMIIQVQDTLGRVLQLFPALRKPIAEAFVPSDRWRFGTLPEPPADLDLLTNSDPESDQPPVDLDVDL